MPIHIFNTFDDPLATFGTKAFGVNDAGQIVGAYDTDSNHLVPPPRLPLK